MAFLGSQADPVGTESNIVNRIVIEDRDLPRMQERFRKIDRVIGALIDPKVSTEIKKQELKEIYDAETRSKLEGTLMVVDTTGFKTEERDYEHTDSGGQIVRKGKMVLYYKEGPNGREYLKDPNDTQGKREFALDKDMLEVAPQSLMDYRNGEKRKIYPVLGERGYFDRVIQVVSSDTQGGQVTEVPTPPQVLPAQDVKAPEIKESPEKLSIMDNESVRDYLRDSQHNEHIRWYLGELRKIAKYQDEQLRIDTYNKYAQAVKASGMPDLIISMLKDVSGIMLPTLIKEGNLKQGTGEWDNAIKVGAGAFGQVVSAVAESKMQQLEFREIMRSRGVILVEGDDNSKIMAQHAEEYVKLQAYVIQQKRDKKT